jgi:hypothetical protein
VQELLAVTNCAIRLWGWVPKSAPEHVGKPTIYRITPWYYVSPTDKEAKEVRKLLEESITDEDYEVAAKVVEWVANNGDTSEYMHNIRVLTATNHIESNRRGIVASAVASYLRAMAKLEIKRVEKVTSNHVGIKGERMKGLELTVTDSRGIASYYGDTILFKFKDAAGNVFSWFSSGQAQLTVGKTYKMDATIKDHTEYQGVKETQLTRAKVA